MITKLDVLSGIDTLRVCTSYRHQEGAVSSDFPYHQSILHNSEAVDEELPGFDEEIGECRSPSDLPPAALEYVNFVAEAIDVPVTLVGVGPGRDQVVWMEKQPSAAGTVPSLSP